MHHIVTQGPPIVSKTGKRKVGVGKGEVQAAGGRRHNPAVQSAEHGEEGGWQLAPLWQFCQLNLVTELDVYPVPYMLDFASKAAGCTVFFQD